MERELLTQMLLKINLPFKELQYVMFFDILVIFLNI